MIISSQNKIKGAIKCHDSKGIVVNYYSCFGILHRISSKFGNGKTFFNCPNLGVRS